MEQAKKNESNSNNQTTGPEISARTISLRLRGTCVALDPSAAGRSAGAPAGWGAVLLRGPSGSGKSDFALRILDHLGANAARLVSDDYVDLAIDLARPCLCALASPPDTIAGRMEVRGVGIVETDYLRGVPLTMLVDLVEARAVERLPVERDEVIYTAADRQALGLPVIACAPFENSSVIKLILSYKQRVGAQALTAGT